MTELIKVVLAEPGKKAEVKVIDGSLKGMQKIVDGMIQPLHFDDAVLICNDEGKIRQLPFNRTVRNDRNEVIDVIAGTFFICGKGKEDFISLDEKTAQKYLQKFFLPEELQRVGNHFLVHPYNP